MFGRCEDSLADKGSVGKIRLDMRVRAWGELEW